MSPKEYFSLLFKCFFKRYTFEEEIEAWDKSMKIKTVLFAGLYNGVLALLIVGLILSIIGIITCIWSNVSLLDSKYYIKFVLFPFVVRISTIAIIIMFIGTLGGIVECFFRNSVMTFVYSLVWSVIFSIYVGFKEGFGIVENTTTYDIYQGIYQGAFFGILASLHKKGISDHIYRGSGRMIGSAIIFGITVFVIKIMYCNVEKSFVTGILVIISYIIFYTLFCGRFYYFFYLPLYKKDNPLRWDENIGISIPFLPQILRGYAKTKDFDETIEFATFLIKKCPMQRLIAQKSLILIALDKMKQVKSIDEMRGLSNKLSFIPSSEDIVNTYSENFENKIEKFSEQRTTNMFASHYMVVLEEYAKHLHPFIIISEDLNRAWNELNRTNLFSIYDRLQKQLLNYRETYHSSYIEFAQDFSDDFGEVADAWQKVLTKTIDDLRAGGKLPIANPYTLGKALQADSDQFLGRRDLIQKIETETLREGAATALLFIGNRRTGKSSTLNNLQRFVQSAVRTVFADLQDAEVTNSTADFCETLTERIAKSLRIPAPPPIRDLAAFTKWLKQRDADLIRDNRYLLICIDEYERLEKVIKQGKLADLPDSLRHWIQHLQHIVFLFAGSHEPSELKGDLDWTDYLINVRNVPISYLEYEAAIQLVTAPVPNFDLTWKRTI
jgi:hypothetical protein